MNEQHPSNYAWASQMPYLWAGLIFTLIGALFVLALLYLRPNLDPLILITVVTGVGGSMFTGVAAYLKSSETHSSVNGSLSKWKEDHYEMAHTKGVLAGAKAEQERQEEAQKLKFISEAVPVPAAAKVMIVPQSDVPPQP
jgi:hypothetical protein